MEFRLATAEDWPSIWPIFSSIVAAGDTYAYDPALSYEQGAAIWLEQPPGRTWLVTEGETVVGTYKCGPNKAGPGAHIGTASFMVSGAKQGRGIGRAMVSHCLEQLTAAGYRGVQFNAVAASNGYAIRLYEDLGFRTVGAVPGGFHHPQQGFLDLLIMYRDL